MQAAWICAQCIQQVVDQSRAAGFGRPRRESQQQRRVLLLLLLWLLLPSLLEVKATSVDETRGTRCRLPSHGLNQWKKKRRKHADATRHLSITAEPSRVHCRRVVFVQPEIVGRPFDERIIVGIDPWNRAHRAYHRIPSAYTSRLHAEFSVPRIRAYISVNALRSATITVMRGVERTI